MAEMQVEAGPVVGLDFEGHFVGALGRWAAEVELEVGHLQVGLQAAPDVGASSCGLLSEDEAFADC